MFTFTASPLYISPGNYLSVKAIAGSLAGYSNYTPQGNTSAFLIKSAPYMISSLTVVVDPISNGTAATLYWGPPKNIYTGFDTISKYTFYMGVYNNSTQSYNYSTLYIAEAPIYNKFKYNVTGLIPGHKYAFKYKISNSYGDSGDSQLKYICPGDFP